MDYAALVGESDGMSDLFEEQCNGAGVCRCLPKDGSWRVMALKKTWGT